MAIQSIDTLWVLISAFLVFFMQAGFGMLEAGLIQTKNTANIVMKNLMDFAAGTFVFWLVGFGLMYGVDKLSIIGVPSLGVSGSFEHLGLSIPLEAFVLFQTVFATTAATIVSGALAGRIKFFAYIIVAVFISAIGYPVIGHWVWGGGWLQNLGMIDFAGSTVVHSVGGWAALVGAYVIGPRIGKYNEDGSVNDIPGSNIVFVALGVFILWFGWFGFNGGSTLSGTTPTIATIAINTNLAAATGAIFAMITARIQSGKVNVTGTLNGALAGLVGITAGCAAVNSVGAIVIGSMAGALSIVASRFIECKLKIDDPVGAVTVHGVCGAFGTVMVGVFAIDGGLLYNGGTELLLTQLIGVAAVFIWTCVASFILFTIADKLFTLRVSKEEEEQGLDASEHSYGNLLSKLQDVSRKQFELSMKLRDNSNALAKHSKNLYHSNEEIFSSIQEISATTQQVTSLSEKTAQDAAQMVNMSSNVSAAATQGNENVNDVENRMKNISYESRNMELVINQLVKSSSKISEITDFIHEISERTNILALNASIESARVGEQGGGFAVIASEIKDLAEKSSDSAKEISAIIQDVRDNTSGVAEKMETTSKEIEKGTAAVHSTKNSFDKIIEEIRNTTDMINKTSQRAEFTNDATNILVESTEQIVSIIKETTDATQNLAEMAKEIKNLIKEYKLNAGVV
ncbi:MAG: ammonium transporter [Firmicutes bacterium]|nr:ammonium transporter [Bacillota bacterium]